MRRGRGPELEDSFVGRIVRSSVLDRTNSRVGGNRRRRKVGLARAQIHDVLPRGLAPLGFRRDRNRRRRLEMLQVWGETFGHRRITPSRIGGLRASEELSPLR